MARLQDLLQRRVEEDTHLEYKAGAWLDEGDAAVEDEGLRPAERLRKYVVGFANALGGVLIIGIGEPGAERLRPMRPVTRFSTVGKAREWVTRAMGGGRPFALEPYVIEHDGGLILILAVPHAPGSPMWSPESGSQAYYYRMGDSTTRLPPYLVEDLILGRRRATELRVDCSGCSIKVRWDLDEQAEIHVDLMVINESLVWLDEGVFGVVAYGCGESGRFVATALVASLDLRAPPTGYGLMHRRDKVTPNRLEPFQHGAAGVALGWRVRFAAHPSPDTVDWNAAVYVVGRDAPPHWFQLSMTCKKPTQLQEATAQFTIEEMFLDRPIVSVTGVR